jgi:hypothetical protein
VREEFIALVTEPTRESYLRVWEKFTSSPEYNPYSSDMEQILPLLNDGRFAEARQRIYDAMARWLLNPRIHLLASAAARGMGDEKTAEMEGFFAVRCLQGITSTGEGSREQPYLVSSVADEYDVLAHFKKSLKTQSLVEDGERVLDVLECQDGSTLCFDITRPYAAIGKRMRSKQ